MKKLSGYPLRSSAYLTVQGWAALLLIFLSRLPFIYNGYGAEEDASGLVLAARHIADTKSYEPSRFPGHPLQEIFYAFIAYSNPWVFNLITAIISTAGIGFFIAALKKLGFRHTVLAGLMLAFTPVIYINSVNAIDYLWSLSFILISFYFLLNKSFITTGAFLAMAVGCRLTSGAILLPFVFWILFKNYSAQSLCNALSLILSTLIISALFYMPLFANYGLNFLSYADQFEVPLLKAVFKMSVGVWGLPASLALAVFIFIISFRVWNQDIILDNTQKKLMYFCFIIIALYLTSYILEPHKSAYLIPAIPFVIIFLKYYLKRFEFSFFAVIVFLSSFITGVSLNNPSRGTIPSSYSLNFKTGSTKLSIDLLKGPVLADRERRINKIQFSQQAVNDILKIKKKTVIIAGFWYNDILIKLPILPEAVKIIYYADEPQLKKFLRGDYEIRYLPEQDVYNDLCYKKNFTNRLARAFYQQDFIF